MKAKVEFTLNGSVIVDIPMFNTPKNDKEEAKLSSLISDMVMDYTTGVDDYVTKEIDEDWTTTVEFL